MGRSALFLGKRELILGREEEFLGTLEILGGYYARGGFDFREGSMLEDLKSKRAVNSRNARL